MMYRVRPAGDQWQIDLFWPDRQFGVTCRKDQKASARKVLLEEARGEEAMIDQALEEAFG